MGSEVAGGGQRDSEYGACQLVEEDGRPSLYAYRVGHQSMWAGGRISS